MDRNLNSNKDLCVFQPLKSCVCLREKLFFLCLLLFFPGNLFAAEQLTVDFDTIIQENFLGINAVYHGFTYMPEAIEMGMTDDLRAIEMQRVEESGIRIARSFYRPDWAMGEGEWVEPDWESVKMQALYKWLADMKQRGVTVALNMGWWFARDVIWNRDQHLPVYPDDMHNYVQWVSESLHQIIELRGFDNVKYIFMFTEPGGSYGDIPGGKETWPYYQEVVRATHDQLVADGRRKLVKMVGPNTTWAPRWIKESTEKLDDILDVYASHNYNFETYNEWYGLASTVRQAVAKTGKPFWVDEYGVQDFELRKSGRYGTVLALANAAFINAGAQTSLLWIMNDQYYPYPLKYITNGDAFLDGLHQWGLYPWLPDSQSVRPAWHAFVMMSRLLGGEGSKVFLTKGGGGLSLVALQDSSGDISLMVVNAGEREKEFSLQLSKNLNKILSRYLYAPIGNGSEDEAVVLYNDKRFPLLQKTLQDTIPSGGVAIYSSRNFAVSGGGEDSLMKRKMSFAGNLALQKNAFALSSDPLWPAENVTDGKRLRYWKSRHKKENSPESITVDLGMVVLVQQVTVFPDENGAEVSGFPEEISLSVSVDQRAWEIVERKTVGNVSSAPQVMRFPAREARYLKVTGEKLRAGAEGYQMSVAEIKVFGP